MISRSPCEVFLKYLVSHKDGFSNVDIKSACIERELDYIGDLYLNRLRAKVRVPDPFKPHDAYHVPSREFLFREGIRVYYDQSERAVTTKANKLLGLPRAKEFIEAMSLVSVPPEAIARAINRHGWINDCTTKAIKRYQHCYWDMQLVSKIQARVLLELRAENVEGNEEDAERHRKAMKKVMGLDGRMIAATMPNSPYTAIVAQVMAGAHFEELDRKKLLEGTFDNALVRAYIVSSSPYPDAEMRLASLASTLKNIAETTNSLRDPEKDLRTQIEQILIKSDRAIVPHINQLSQGRHTVEMDKAASPVKDDDEGE